MSMPTEWVESLFARLSATYGNRFSRMWEAVDAEAVKSVWAETLGSIDPKSVRHALDNLPPTYPPTVMEFRALCLSSPVLAPLPMLTADPIAPAEAARIAKAAKSALAMDGSPTAWADRLRAREEAGERLTQAQRDMWRAALRRKTAQKGAA